MSGTDKYIYFSLISKILQQIVNILLLSKEKMQVSLYLFLDLENKLTFSSAFSIYIVRGPYLTLHEVHTSAQLISVSLFCFVLLYTLMFPIFSPWFTSQTFHILPRAKEIKQVPTLNCSKNSKSPPNTRVTGWKIICLFSTKWFILQKLPITKRGHGFQKADPSAKITVYL